MSRFCVVCLFFAIVATLATERANADTVTYAGDSYRTGWHPTEAGELSPATISNNGSFGFLFKTAVKGQVYAQPLVYKGKVYVVTQANHVYSLHPFTGEIIEHMALGPPTLYTDHGCTDLTPFIGVTGTPVIDPSTDTLYLWSKTYSPLNGGPAAQVWQFHGINLKTWVFAPNFPYTIRRGSLAADVDPSITLDPLVHHQRPSLLLMDGVVYAAFGSHCDIGKYRGWVIGMNVSTGQPTTVFVTVKNSSEWGAGIWMSGGGLSSDRPGSMFFSVGNGARGRFTWPQSPVPGLGNPNPPDVAEAVVRISLDGNGKLQVTDFFIPSNGEYLDFIDADMGSSGVSVLAPGFSNTSLVVETGKTGIMWIMNANDMGGFRMGPANGDRVNGQDSTKSGFAHTSSWISDQGPIAYAGAPLIAFGPASVLRNNVSMDSLIRIGQAAGSFGQGSTAVTITSNGNDSTTGVLWSVWMTNAIGINAQLRAYGAIPDSVGILPLLWSYTIPRATRYTPPGVGNGRIYLGTCDAQSNDGFVFGFGIPVEAVLRSSPSSVDFETVLAGSISPPVTVNVTIQTKLTVLGVMASSPSFLIDSQDIVVDANLNTLGFFPHEFLLGDVFAVMVHCAPTHTGGTSGQLVVSTDAGPFFIPMSCYGLSDVAHLDLSPADLLLSMGGVISNSPPVEFTIEYINNGASPCIVYGVDLPGDPFEVIGLPPMNFTIPPLQRIAVVIRLKTNLLGSFSPTLRLYSTGGNLPLMITGSVAMPPVMTVFPMELQFGRVLVGSTYTQSFMITNKGDSTLSILKNKPPTGVFSPIGFPITEETLIPPLSSMKIDLTFSPTSIGDTSAVWVLNGNDGSGVVRFLNLTGTGISPSNILPNPEIPSWTANGDAYIITDDLTNTRKLYLSATSGASRGTAFFKQLQNATAQQDGDTIFSHGPDQSVNASSLYTYFRFSLDNWLGDPRSGGMAFLLASPCAGTRAIGDPGQGYGFSHSGQLLYWQKDAFNTMFPTIGFSTYAVVLDVYRDPEDASSNAVQLLFNNASSMFSRPQLIARSSISPVLNNLRFGVHSTQVKLTTRANPLGSKPRTRLDVRVDGVRYISAYLPTDSNINLNSTLVGFSGSTNYNYGQYAQFAVYNTLIQSPVTQAFCPSLSETDPVSSPSPFPSPSSFLSPSL